MKTVIISSFAVLLPQLYGASFEAPQLLKTSEGAIAVEGPGYASPCLADVDGDGKKDLLVGQFREGKIMVYPGKGGLEFGKGKWLEVNGKPASVPGVW